MRTNYGHTSIQYNCRDIKRDKTTFTQRVRTDNHVVSFLKRQDCGKLLFAESKRRPLSHASRTMFSSFKINKCMFVCLTSKFLLSSTKNKRKKVSPAQIESSCYYSAASRHHCINGEIQNHRACPGRVRVGVEL